ncbi:hypothetical protein [Paludibacterium sp.]|uniref:hypothetical protein n=1 Tax=Paludibacterium sp. TaxID=1917523 RepID=UPI0025F4A159|nr:hypothetical protein [Paludibacterium sp.]MBV8647481.1 hypothetical protein [Paludibacterium sp.]
MTNKTTLSVAVALSLDDGLKSGLAAVIQQVKEADRSADSFAARLVKIQQAIRLVNDIAASGKKLYGLFQPAGATGGGKTPDAGRAAPRPGKQNSGGERGGFDFVAAAKQAAELYKTAKPVVDGLFGGQSGSTTAGRSGARSRQRAAGGKASRSAGGDRGGADMLAATQQITAGKANGGFDPFAAAKRLSDFYLAQAGKGGQGKKGKNSQGGEDKLEGPVATLVQVNKLIQEIPKLTGKPLPANLGPLADGMTKAAVAVSKDPALLSVLSQTFGAMSQIFTASGLPAKFQSLGMAFTQMRGLLDSGIDPAIQRGIGALGQAGNAFRVIGGLISGPIGSALNLGIKLVGVFGEALSAAGMVLMANPVVAGIALAIAVIVGALWYFRDSLSGIGDTIIGAWKKLKDVFHLGGDTPAKSAATGAVPMAGKAPPAAAMVPPVPPRGRFTPAAPANLYMTHEGKSVLVATVTAGQTKAANRPATGGRQADPTAMTVRSSMANHIYARG